MSSAAVGTLQPEAVASLAPLWPAPATHRPPWRRHGGRCSDAGEAGPGGGAMGGAEREAGPVRGGGGTAVLQSPVSSTQPLFREKRAPKDWKKVPLPFSVLKFSVVFLLR